MLRYWQLFKNGIGLLKFFMPKQNHSFKCYKTSSSWKLIAC